MLEYEQVKFLKEIPNLFWQYVLAGLIILILLGKFVAPSLYRNIKKLFGKDVGYFWRKGANNLNTAEMRLPTKSLDEEPTISETTEKFYFVPKFPHLMPKDFMPTTKNEGKTGVTQPASKPAGTHYNSSRIRKIRHAPIGFHENRAKLLHQRPELRSSKTSLEMRQPLDKKYSGLSMREAIDLCLANMMSLTTMTFLEKLQNKLTNGKTKQPTKQDDAMKHQTKPSRQAKVNGTMKKIVKQVGSESSCFKLVADFR